jgi:hypothetical protein
MNEDMKAAWLEISQMLGEPTREELDVFLRTWQRAILAEREECAKVCEENADDLSEGDWDDACMNCATVIRTRGQP